MRARVAAVVATELTVTVIAAIAALLLATYDVHVRADGRDISCGGAYDVALLQRDCYMGGEMARDQDAVDRTGVARAWTYLGLAGLAGLGAARSGAYAAILLTRWVRQRDGRVADPEGFVRA